MVLSRWHQNFLTDRLFLTTPCPPSCLAHSTGSPPFLRLRRLLISHTWRSRALLMASSLDSSIAPWLIISPILVHRPSVIAFTTTRWDFRIPFRQIRPTRCLPLLRRLRTSHSTAILRRVTIRPWATIKTPTRSPLHTIPRTLTYPSSSLSSSSSPH